MDLFNSSMDPYPPRAQSAVGSPRSKLANIFGRPPTAVGPNQQLDGGFMTSANGKTMLTPRACIPGTVLRPGARPMSPREVATAAAEMRYSSPRSPRSQRYSSPREDQIAQRMAESQARIAYNHQRDKMKLLMRSISNSKGEVPVAEMEMAAELANVPFRKDQQTLLLQTPYANGFASTWDVTAGSPRSMYGLECNPKSVKWRALDAALEHGRMTPESVSRKLNHYANKEAAEIAKVKAEQDKATEVARSKTAETGKPVSAVQVMSDDQLRMVHKTVKTRLSTQYNNVRDIFKAMDSDRSGTISPEECVTALMTLNVGLPRKFIEHLINIADSDRDGEINVAEFTRILECDDITKMKVAGAEEEGLVVRAKVSDLWKPGIYKSELKTAQGKIKDMLEERGGITKMFRIIDEDKSGWCSRKELRMLMIHLNLESVVRPQVLEALMDLMDIDGDDQIRYNEFARVCAPGATSDLFDVTPEERELLKHKEAEVTTTKKKKKKKRP